MKNVSKIQFINILLINYYYLYIFSLQKLPDIIILNTTD